MAKLGLMTYPDLASSSIVDCRGGWFRSVMLCSTTIWATLYVHTSEKELGPWTTSLTAFSSKHPTSGVRVMLTGPRQVNDFPNLAKVAKWFKTRFEPIKKTVPSFLRPKYFAIV